MSVGPVLALGGINIHDSALVSAKIVDVEDWRDFDAPIDRLEAGVAMEQVK